jgi:uncharacterized cofD-like protein
MKQQSPNVVVLGGGTGLSSMLRGLKKHVQHITAIVTVTDDGGGSGILRRELGMLPPGDIRNCIQALANAEPAMQDLLGYRFREGSLAGQSLGNLLLAALNDMCPTFDQAVETLSQVLAITGRVLPVTNENILLQARFTDGALVRGETCITDYKKKHPALIDRVSLEPAHVQALPQALEAIGRADMIVLGPGSLYTSIIPNLLIEGVAPAICQSQAVKVYVMNVMTQDGETECYTATDHVKALLRHGGQGLFHYVLANDMDIPELSLGAYRQENAVPVPVDTDELAALGLETYLASMASWSDGFVRHDSTALARALMSLYYANAATRKVEEWS